MDKLKQLAEVEGMSELELLEMATMDSVAYGICIADDCDYTTEVEPDNDSGYCECCGTNTVASCLTIAGMI